MGRMASKDEVKTRRVDLGGGVIMFMLTPADEVPPRIRRERVNGKANGANGTSRS